MKRELFKPQISLNDILISVQNKLNAILKPIIKSEDKFSKNNELNNEIISILNESFKSSVKINPPPVLNGNILLVNFEMNIEYNDVFYLNKHLILKGQVRNNFLNEVDGRLIELNRFNLLYNVTNKEHAFINEVFKIEEDLDMIYPFEQDQNYQDLIDYCIQLKNILSNNQTEK